MGCDFVWSALFSVCPALLCEKSFRAPGSLPPPHTAHLPVVGPSLPCRLCCSEEFCPCIMKPPSFRLCGCTARGFTKALGTRAVTVTGFSLSFMGTMNMVIVFPVTLLSGTYYLLLIAYDGYLFVLKCW